MISGFKRISPVLSVRALAKRKAKIIFSQAIGKATLQRSLQYKVICQLVIVNGNGVCFFCAIIPQKQENMTRLSLRGRAADASFKAK